VYKKLGHKEIDLAEVGPRLEMKLFKLRLGNPYHSYSLCSTPAHDGHRFAGPTRGGERMGAATVHEHGQETQGSLILNIVVRHPDSGDRDPETFSWCREEKQRTAMICDACVSPQMYMTYLSTNHIVRNIAEW
jgi:hypothetical protein